MVNFHEHDLNLWLEQQAIAIKNKNIDSMDWKNLLCPFGTPSDMVYRDPLGGKFPQR